MAQLAFQFSHASAAPAAQARERGSGVCAHGVLSPSNKADGFVRVTLHCAARGSAQYAAVHLRASVLPASFVLVGR